MYDEWRMEIKGEERRGGRGELEYYFCVENKC